MYLARARLVGVMVARPGGSRRGPGKHTAGWKVLQPTRPRPAHLHAGLCDDPSDIPMIAGLFNILAAHQAQTRSTISRHESFTYLTIVGQHACMCNVHELYQTDKRDTTPLADDRMRVFRGRAIHQALVIYQTHQTFIKAHATNTKACTRQRKSFAPTTCLCFLLPLCDVLDSSTVFTSRLLSRDYAFYSI